MKRLYSIYEALVFATLLCCCLPRMAKADEPLNFSATLDKFRVMQGEPFIVSYSIENFTSHPMTVDLGPTAREWIHIVVLDDKGNRVAVRPDRHPPVIQNERSLLSPIELLKFRDMHKGSSVVTRDFTIARPGFYRVIVQAKVSYHAGKRYDMPDQPNPFAGNTWSAERTFQVTVIPADRSRLLQAAEAWGKLALTSKDYKESDIAIQALFFMPEEIAMPTWKRVVAVIGARPTVREELVRLSTANSLELLTMIAKDTRHPSEASELAQRDLQLIYESGDPKMRPQLIGLFRSLGIAPPPLPESSKGSNP